MLIAALACSALLLRVSTPFQDRGTPPAKKWTQAELERVSDEIRSDIEAQRGMKFTRSVKVKVTDAAGFLQYMRKRQEKTETPERLARDEKIAKMLGLIPPGMDLQAALEKLLESQVGGFYDPGTDTFYLIETFGGDIARIILSHELTHALDDQCFDLDANLKRLHEETDAEFAFQALAEGSGTSAMNQWTMQHLQDLDRKALLDSADLGTKGLEEAPDFLWKPLLAAYLLGEGFLTRTGGVNLAMKPSEPADIRQAFAHPPRSSEQILHPAKYWDPAQADEPRKVEFDLGKLPPGWKVLGEDTLGELYLALVTTPLDQRKPLDVKNPLAIVSLKFTNPAAEGWGGDRAVLLGKGDARVLWLVTAWDRPEDAAEFLDAASKVLRIPASGDSPPDGRFRYRIDRQGDSDVVVLVVSEGVASADLPNPSWKVAPRSRPGAEEKR